MSSRKRKHSDKQKAGGRKRQKSNKQTAVQHDSDEDEISTVISTAEEIAPETMEDAPATPAAATTHTEDDSSDGMDTDIDMDEIDTDGASSVDSVLTADVDPDSKKRMNWQKLWIPAAKKILKSFVEEPRPGERTMNVTFKPASELILTDILTHLLERLFSAALTHAIRDAKTEIIDEAAVEHAAQRVLSGALLKHALNEAKKAETNSGALVITPAIITKAKIAMKIPRTVSETAIIHLAAIMDYMCAEILELSRNCVLDVNRRRLKPRWMFLAIHNDEELNVAIKGVLNAGGVELNIRSQLFNDAPRDARGRVQLTALRHIDAYREIQREQRSTDVVSRLRPFKRTIDAAAAGVDVSLPFTDRAVDVLQVAGEAYLIDVFRRSLDRAIDRGARHFKITDADVREAAAGITAAMAQREDVVWRYDPLTPALPRTATETTEDGMTDGRRERKGKAAKGKSSAKKVAAAKKATAR